MATTIPITLVWGLPLTGKSSLIRNALVNKDYGAVAIVTVNNGSENQPHPGLQDLPAGLMVQRAEEQYIGDGDDVEEDDEDSGVPFRIDLMEEVCKLVGRADVKRIVIECPGLEDPASYIASFDSPIPVGFVEQRPNLHLQKVAKRVGRGPVTKLLDIVHIEHKICMVDPTLLWKMWESVATVIEDPMDCDVDEMDNRPLSLVQANMIETATTLLITNTNKAEQSIIADTHALIALLNPTASVLECDPKSVAISAVFNTTNSTNTNNATTTTTDTTTNTNTNNDTTPSLRVFEYARRTPFHPERFFGWCDRYFFLSAFQYEEGIGEEDDHLDDGDVDWETDDDEASDINDGADDERNDGNDDTTNVNESATSHHENEPDANADDSDFDVLKERNVAKQEMDKAWGTKHVGSAGRVVRCSGLAWIAGYHGLRTELSQTGAFLSLEMGKPYFAALESKDWIELYDMAEHPALAAECKAHEHGDRKVSLRFFVRSSFNDTALAAELDGCLLTDEEMQAGPRAWIDLNDPFHMIGPESKAMYTNSKVHEDEQPPSKPLVCPVATPSNKPFVGLSSSVPPVVVEVPTASDDENVEQMKAVLRQLPPKQLFVTAVYAALLKWDALEFALKEGIRDDGDEIAAWMPTVVAELFEGKKAVEQDEIEDYIMDIMEAEFEVEFEDVPETTRHVARQIVQFKRDCANGGNDELFAFIVKVHNETNKFDDIFPPVLVPMESGDKPLNSENGASAVDAKDVTVGQVEPEEDEVDPDGWEVVTPKKKKR